MKIGYARVSTEDQLLDRQIESLKKAGCERIYQEKISSGKLNRPELSRMLDLIWSDHPDWTLLPDRDDAQTAQEMD